MATLRDDRSRRSRDMILDAAVELFAENSYRGTSLVDVAERSGVSRGSIPWHFGDKQGLLQAVVERLQKDQDVRLAVELPASVEGAKLIAEHASYAIRGPDGKALLALLLEAVRPESPIHESFAEIHATARQHYARWLRRPAVADGLPDGVEPEQVATALLGAIIGINQQWNLNPLGVDLEGSHAALVRTMFSWLDWESGNASSA